MATLQELRFDNLVAPGKTASSIAELDFSDLAEPNQPETFDLNEPPVVSRIEPPAMIAQEGLKDREGLIAKASELKTRLGMQFWNKFIAETAHALSAPDVDTPTAMALDIQRKWKKNKTDWYADGDTTPARNELRFNLLVKTLKGQYKSEPGVHPDIDAAIEQLKKLGKYPYQPPKKPALAFDVAPAETIGEKAVDVGTGLASFIAKVVLVKNRLPGINEGLAWEIVNQIDGGKPGEGLGMYATFGAAGKVGKGLAAKIPGGTVLGKAGKVAAEVAPQSAAMFAIAKVGGAETEDAIMQALIPVAYKALDIAVNEGPEYVRGKLEQRAVKILRNQAGKVIDLSKVPDESLKVIVESAKQGRVLQKDLAKGKISAEQYNQQADELNIRLQPIFKAIAKSQPEKPVAEQPQTKTATPATIARPQTTSAAASGRLMTKPPARVGTIVGPPIAPSAEKPRLANVDFSDLAQPQETPKPTPETQPIVKPKIVPIEEIPVWDIKLSKDVPNFKKGASASTGIIEGQELAGKYERLATAPILVWERKDGRLEIITGRHRWDLARRTGEKTIPAQVLKESEGFTKAMALTADAESNIREGQGGVADYAQYFRNSPEIDEKSARARGLLSRSKGEAGFRIGKDAVDDVYAAFLGGQISDAKAAAIAQGAPNNESAQLAAMSKADKMSSDELEQFARILTRSTPSDKLKPRQGNLFGFDDSALQEAEAVAREVGKESTSIKERILSVKGALRRPDIARKMGLEFSDEKSIQAEVGRLTQRLDDLKRTSTTPALWREMKLRAGLGDTGYPGEKQPWEMTREEFEAQNKEVRKIAGMAKEVADKWLREKPDFGPLKMVVPEKQRDGFMFMGTQEADPSGVPKLWLYKHGITRKYLRIDSEGRTWGWLGDDKIIRQIPHNTAFEQVYAGIEELSGVGGKPATRETPYSDEFKAEKDKALEKAGFKTIRTVPGQPIEVSGESGTHRHFVAEAVEQGKSVPRSILEEYKGEKWADEALAKLEGPPRGGRETGATSLIPDIVSEGLSLGRALINHPTTLISSTAKMLWRNVRRGTNHIRTLGGAGKLLAKDLEEITFRITQNANNDRLDLKKAYAGLNSEQRQTVAKIINGRLNQKTQPPKFVERANRVREILDRGMKAGAELGMTRKVKGEQLPLWGSGKAYPQVPNKAGVEFLNEAEAKGLGSAKVFAWAQTQVQAGIYRNVDEAVDALHRFREIRIRGLNPYLESERVELPDEYVEWDGANILPHLIERNWMTVEGIRQWGKDFGRVFSRLEQIKSNYGPKAAKRVETFIATSFGKMSPASTEAQNISNAVRGYQYATKVGISPITILRNMFDRFAKMLVISQNPKVVATALKEYPPFANAFIDSARKLEEKFMRAGAVFGHGSIAEGYEPGSMVSEIIGKPFSESEKGNQVFIALVRYHQLLKDIDTWQQRKGADSVTTRLANRLGLALKDPTKYRLQEHGSKILDALEKGKPVTDDMINEALHYTVRDKAFPVVLSTKPLWWETQPLLKIFTQFKTWPKEQLGMLWNDVVKYTVKTGDGKRLAGFLVGTIIAGELYNIVRDYLYEKDESITSQFFKEDKHWARAVINDLLDGGIVGILADFTYGIYDWAAGPSLATGRNIRDAAVAAYKRPSLTVPAVTRLIQQEATPVRQVIKTWDKIDRRFINKRNITKDYFKVRDWAWQYRNGYIKPDMLDKIQGVADDLIYGKVRYKPDDNTLAYQMAARQIMVGDIEDAKAYFKNIIKNSEEKDSSKLFSTIERTMKAHYSPYGHILDEKEGDFLKQLPEKERQIAQTVQEQWQKNMAEALYSLMSERDLQTAILKNTSHDINKPETYNRPHKGKEEQVKQWKDELQRRQGTK